MKMVGCASRRVIGEVIIVYVPGVTVPLKCQYYQTVN